MDLPYLNRSFKGTQQSARLNSARIQAQAFIERDQYKQKYLNQRRKQFNSNFNRKQKIIHRSQMKLLHSPFNSNPLAAKEIAENQAFLQRQVLKQSRRKESKSRSSIVTYEQELNKLRKEYQEISTSKDYLDEKRLLAALGIDK